MDETVADMLTGDRENNEPTSPNEANSPNGEDSSIKTFTS